MSGPCLGISKLHLSAGVKIAGKILEAHLQAVTLNTIFLHQFHKAIGVY